ncbi:MAG: hypothetical protein RL728_109 [Bacteroidota bacterium]|jgi:predicted RecB family nuclease
MISNRILKHCENGHSFYKSSNCSTCPKCEDERKSKDDFLSFLVAPARRALESIEIKTIEDLSKYTEKEILALHGMGKSSVLKLKMLLAKEGLSFKY